MHTYAYHIVYYQGKCEALHEITDFVHEMLSVYAPLEEVMQVQHMEIRNPLNLTVKCFLI